MDNDGASPFELCESNWPWMQGAAKQAQNGGFFFKVIPPINANPLDRFLVDVHAVMYNPFTQLNLFHHHGIIYYIGFYVLSTVFLLLKRLNQDEFEAD